MLKVISIILIGSGFIIIIFYQGFPYDNKTKGIFWSNKQKKRSGLIIGYGCLVLGAYLIIRSFLI